MSEEKRRRRKIRSGIVGFKDNNSFLYYVYAKDENTGIEFIKIPVFEKQLRDILSDIEKAKRDGLKEFSGGFTSDEETRIEYRSNL